MSKFLKKPQEKASIYITSTKNNTLITLTSAPGKTHFWASAGSVGFKNSRKSTSYAAQAAAETVAAKALNLGFSSFTIYLKGLGYGKDSCVRVFSKAGLLITQIIETTPVVHNGCRPPRKRRI